MKFVVSLVFLSSILSLSALAGLTPSEPDSPPSPMGPLRREERVVISQVHAPYAHSRMASNAENDNSGPAEPLGDSSANGMSVLRLDESNSGSGIGALLIRLPRSGSSTVQALLNADSTPFETTLTGSGLDLDAIRDIVKDILKNKDEAHQAKLFTELGVAIQRQISIQRRPEAEWYHSDPQLPIFRIIIESDDAIVLLS